MDRRRFVQTAVAATGLALLGQLRMSPNANAMQFGDLLPPNADGLQLPAGFSSWVIAVTGEQVGTTGYRWHPNPDGGATFAQPGGGWIYVSNDEASNGRGGVSMVRFSSDGTIVDARQILSGTDRNCAGGPTPWGTWLSCEEVDEGRVWECDPTGESRAIVRPAMGTFRHEAAAADPDGHVIYLTEDKRDSALYRFTPTAWGDLSAGLLEAMVETATGIGWQPVPDPTAASDTTRTQLRDSKRFDGGEGAWFGDGHLYFTTKGDNRVWRYTPSTNALDIIYDIETSPTPVLSGVDNVTLSASGDLYVCEDGGNMEVVVITAAGVVEPFLRMDVDGSEVTGAAFDPSGTRMYVSSQRNPGVTYEITGPFGEQPGPASEDQAVAAATRRRYSQGATDGPR